MEFVLQLYEEVRDIRVLIEEDFEEKKQEDEDGNVNEGEDFFEEVLVSEEKLFNEGFGIKLGFFAGYVFFCKIESVQLMLVIERVIIRECKQEIVDVVCGIQEGGVYLGFFFNICYFKGELFVGGFRDMYV